VPYEEISHAIARLAEELAMRQHPKLPSERELALRFDTSRTTVRRALTDLEDRSVIRRVRGRTGGAYLNGSAAVPLGPEQVPTQGSKRKVHRDLNRITSVPRMLKSQGFTTGTRVVAGTLEVPEPSVADFLNLAEGDLVASILRVRFADGETLSLERMFVSSQRFPALLDSSLQGSLYDLFAGRFGVVVGQADETIEATQAPEQVSDLLGVNPGDPLIKLTRTAFDTDGAPFEYSVDLFRADRTRLTVRTTNPLERVRPLASR
jgi:GntR family transcriptional regulator